MSFRQWTSLFNEEVFWLSVIVVAKCVRLSLETYSSVLCVFCTNVVYYAHLESIRHNNWGVRTFDPGKCGTSVLINFWTFILKNIVISRLYYKHCSVRLAKMTNVIVQSGTRAGFLAASAWSRYMHSTWCYQFHLNRTETCWYVRSRSSLLLIDRVLGGFEL